MESWFTFDFHTLIYGLKPAWKFLKRRAQIDLKKFLQLKCRRIWKNRTGSPLKSSN